ncbi:hypothetical protein MRA01_63170 [Methylobacterium radiotolerans]|nr:hypothetical protein MRA01_63170 [Methylobacterium radiotolerans]
MADRVTALPTGMEVPNWRALRQRHKLTQRELAGLVHRTTDAIRKWESSAPGAKQQGDLACWHLALLLLGEIPLPEQTNGR